MARFTKSQKVLFAIRNRALKCSLKYLKSKNTTTGYWYGRQDDDGWRNIYKFSVNGIVLKFGFGEIFVTGNEEFPKPLTIVDIRKLSVDEIVELIVSKFEPALLNDKEVVTILSPSIAKYTDNKEYAYKLYKDGICPCGHKIGKRLKANSPCPKCGDPL